ncbi:MAG: hypothetical protein DRP01_08470 [Archaeoglobales archaeon]|nr:MAG: hypothetical protein DRP01_08470 [Archaeoglobales archaeon]
MKVVDSIKDVDFVDFVILTGDGIWELKVLKGLQKKFPCILTLFYPKVPIPRKTGKSIYEAIPVYVSRYKINRFLVLCDNEHHISFNEDLKNLKNSNVKILKTEELIEDRILYIYGKFASKKLEIYTVIQGFNRLKNCKGLNEEISKLIYLKFRKNIEPNNKKIKEFLNRRRMNLTELVERSGKKYLKV